MSLEISKQKFLLYQKIRNYFLEEDILEVETPCLSKGTLIDTYINPLKVGDSYLQTSPELFMKRLISRGYPSIFQICKAFRQEEVGSKHRVEFSLLEWYRLGWSWGELVKDVIQIIHLVKPDIAIEKMSYQEAFVKNLGVCPFKSSIIDLQNILKEQLPNFPRLLSRVEILMVLFSQKIETCFDKNKITIVYHYPASQSNLAKKSSIDSSVSLRFEVFCGGLEIGNGFEELNTKEEYLNCFNKENKNRKALNKLLLKIDQFFLNEIKERPLPFCSGIAIGLDRLLMLNLDTDDIQNVLEFEPL